MSKRKRSEQRMSPYKRHGKTPYMYQHRNCGHKNTVIQSIERWAGKVCTVCNVVVDGPYQGERRG